jgi:16S rRNA (guanine527-N7)-methyltransferase
MINVSAEVFGSLKNYQELVLKWNRTINLVSSNSIKEFWKRHILDSLQLLQFIDNKDVYLVDIGTGAGLPGVVLSIAGIQEVSLIESDTRKCVFLKKASKISNNNIEIINQRVEAIKINCDILTCRAFAPLNRLFSYIKNVEVKEKFLLLKGENCLMELEQAKKNWSFDYSLYKSITSREGKILEISNLVKLHDCQNHSDS